MRDVKQVNLYLDANLYEQIREFAARNHTTITSVLNQAMSFYLKNAEEIKKFDEIENAENLKNFSSENAL
ncbi:MAG TPA: hypothetical protein PLM73_02870 [Petrotogaceae bacterium]|jgi:hypothetical protein|nr:hypothetical protein [Petrotogaceae bacterium]HOG33696.1 hypothetical protein [Petrotogaceae bacterium]HPG48046.1 hypothetical protein [Petrotogaceae bacterium]HPO27465.1 hypothetical protein [Petrotogaceae bacterium]HPX14994.1 hypothetical protein [Petrotogaceae bacterium]